MLSVKDVSEKLNISLGAVYKAINAGELECHRFGKTIRISTEQLSAFVTNSVVR